MRFYRPKHFTIDELVPPDFLETAGEERAWLSIDPRILWTLDAIRDYYKRPISLNNWKIWKPGMGKRWTQRGYRTEYNPATPASQHYFGRAADFVIKGVSAAQFWRDVKAGKLDKEMSYVTAIEYGPGVTWCHVDCRAISGTNIVFFKQS